MAERIDIERMIMQTNYELSLTTPSVSNPSVNMDYEKRIKDLLQATFTLLESNKNLGEKIELQIKRNQVLTDENEALHAKAAKLEGQLEQLKRDKFGRSNEKNPGKPKPYKGITKDEEGDVSYVQREDEHVQTDHPELEAES